MQVSLMQLFGTSLLELLVGYLMFYFESMLFDVVIIIKVVHQNATKISIMFLSNKIRKIITQVAKTAVFTN